MSRSNRIYWQAACLLLALAQPAFAHKLNLFATYAAKDIEGSAYFPTGPAPGLTVKLFDTTQHAIAETECDQQGQFKFTVNSQPPFTLVSETEDGHRAEFKIDSEEAAHAMPQSDAPSPTATDPAVAALVQKAVHDELQPLREDLARDRDRARMHEIVAGLGYIAGVFGLWSLLRRRTKRS